MSGGGVTVYCANLNFQHVEDMILRIQVMILSVYGQEF